MASSLPRSRAPGILAPVTTACALGNRCGHVPSVLRYHLLQLPQEANKARPALIAKAIARARHYFLNPRDPDWDALSQSERRHRLTRQIAAVGPKTCHGQALEARALKWRQQRSERREALILVLSLLLSYTDIATLTVAVPRGPDWLGLSLPWIAAHTGLSPSRAKRAIATLARASLLTNTGRGRQFDRRRRCWVGTGWGPIRRLSFRLIRALGLDVAWQQAQRKARKQARSAAPPSTPKPTPAPMPALTPDLVPLAQTAATLTPSEQRERAQSLRQALNPAAAHSEPRRISAPEDLARTRQLADLATQGLSLSELRRLQHTAQPPDSS